MGEMARTLPSIETIQTIATVREQERLWDAGRPLRLIAVTLISHRITTLADVSTGPSRALCYILGGAH